MADSSILGFLEDHPLFHDLEPKHRELIASCASEKSYGAQQRIFKQDAPAGEFFIVRDGKVAIEIPAISGAPLTIQSLGPGKVTGWSWLIPPFRWSFDARCIEPSSVVSIQGKPLLDYCEADPALGYELMRRFAMLMGERLEAARNKVMEEYRGF